MKIPFTKLLKIKGFPMQKATEYYNSIPQGDGLIDWQLKKRREIFEYHKNTNTQYQSLIKNEIKNWTDIPIIQKSDLQHCSSINQYKNKKFYIRSTSGSTGTPFIYALDYFGHALTWQIYINRYKQLDVSLDDRQARFFGSPMNKKEKVGEKIKDYLSNRYRFSLLDLSDETFVKWIKKMKKKKLQYIYGYSFPIISFAQYLYREGITLKDECPDLKAVIVTAEMCSEPDRLLIQKACGVKVANEYGASEIGIIGFNSGSFWKISHELVFIEIVDDNNNILPDGSVGRVICTSLFNKGTPFIRYDIGDLGTIENINGERVLTKLEGRREELMFLPSGKKLPGDTFFYYIIKDFTQRYKDLTEYRVIQKTITDFDILFVSKSSLSEKDIQFFKKLVFNKLNNENINLNFAPVKYIERSAMGKFRRFISLVSN